MTDAPASGASAAASEPARAWWRLPFGMFQTNLREIDATLDVEAVLDYIQGHGADAWLVNAGGILSFFPTDLPIRHDRSAGVDGDPPIGRQIEGGSAPHLSEKMRVDRGLDLVSALVGEQHRDDGVKVLLGRRPERVAVDRVHDGSVHWRPRPNIDPNEVD